MQEEEQRATLRGEVRRLQDARSDLQRQVKQSHSSFNHQRDQLLDLQHQARGRGGERSFGVWEGGGGGGGLQHQTRGGPCSPAVEGRRRLGAGQAGTVGRDLQCNIRPEGG